MIIKSTTNQWQEFCSKQKRLGGAKDPPLYSDSAALWPDDQWWPRGLSNFNLNKFYWTCSFRGVFVDSKGRERKRYPFTFIPSQFPHSAIRPSVAAQTPNRYFCRRDPYAPGVSCGNRRWGSLRARVHISFFAGQRQPDWSWGSANNPYSQKRARNSERKSTRRAQTNKMLGR